MKNSKLPTTDSKNHNFGGGARMEAVAEQRLDVLYPDGAMVPVCLRIGRLRPHPGGRGDWGCVVQAEGLRIWEGPSELFGAGSLHALMIAASFLHRMVSAEVERGAVPHWPGGADALGIDGLFALPMAPDFQGAAADRPFLLHAGILG